LEEQKIQKSKITSLQIQNQISSDINEIKPSSIDIKNESNSDL